MEWVLHGKNWLSVPLVVGVVFSECGQTLTRQYLTGQRPIAYRCLSLIELGLVFKNATFPLDTRTMERRVAQSRCTFCSPLSGVVGPIPWWFTRLGLSTSLEREDGDQCHGLCVDCRCQVWPEGANSQADFRIGWPASHRCSLFWNPPAWVVLSMFLQPSVCTVALCVFWHCVYSGTVCTLSNVGVITSRNCQ